MSYTFNDLLVLADFYANQNYITANLCINKDKPWMHCNGQCQLAKKMQEQDSKNKQGTDHKSENKTEAVCVAYLPLQPKENAATVSFYLSNSRFIPLGKSNDIFHPPQILFS